MYSYVKEFVVGAGGARGSCITGTYFRKRKEVFLFSFSLRRYPWAYALRLMSGNGRSNSHCGLFIYLDGVSRWSNKRAKTYIEKPVNSKDS